MQYSTMLGFVSFLSDLKCVLNNRCIFKSVQIILRKIMSKQYNPYKIFYVIIIVVNV